MKEDCQATLTFLGLYNFMATKVEVFNTDTELNKQWNIKKTPGDAEGVQINFKESLEEQIARLQRKGDLEEDVVGSR